MLCWVTKLTDFCLGSFFYGCFTHAQHKPEAQASFHTLLWLFSHAQHKPGAQAPFHRLNVVTSVGPVSGQVAEKTHVCPCGRDGLQRGAAGQL